MTEVVFDPAAQADLLRLDGSKRKPVLKAVAKLARNPEAGKPLRYELKGHRSLRTGDVRIVYELLPGKVRVWLVGQRTDDEVYEAALRRLTRERPIKRRRRFRRRR